nr:hypothetical protein [Anaerolineae bacterium]
LVDRMNRARRMPPESSVTVEDVEAVIPMIFERGKNYFYDQYRAQSGGPAGQALLDQMARSPQWTLTRAEMSAIVPDESELRRTIRTMTRREMIHMVGDDRYQITVPLFARYVAQVSG